SPPCPTPSPAVRNCFPPPRKASPFSASPGDRAALPPAASAPPPARPAVRWARNIPATAECPVRSSSRAASQAHPVSLRAIREGCARSSAYDAKGERGIRNLPLAGRTRRDGEYPVVEIAHAARIEPGFQFLGRVSLRDPVGQRRALRILRREIEE